jgi:hypothetical protein
MPVHCAKCGEELLGAVNRCWRCGAALVPQTGPAGIPPIRRAPVEEPLDAAVIDDETSAESDRPNAESARDEQANGDTAPSEANAETAVATEDAAKNEPRENNAPRGHKAQTNEPNAGEPNAGVPNASAAAKSGVRVDPAHSAAAPKPAPKPAPTTGTLTTGTPGSRSPATSISYRGRTAALGGAIGAVALGALAIVSAVLFPLGGVLTAILGLAMGIWGLFSQRRLLAFAGIILCCLALATGAILGGIQLYDAAIGHKPWEEASEPDVWDDEF